MTDWGFNNNIKMKEKKTSIFTGVIVTALAAICYVAYGQYQNRQIVYANPLMEENIDALAENTPSCMLIRDSCSFTITTQLQIDFLKNYIPNTGFNITVDLTPFTAVYALNDGSHTVVSCGQDCTCTCFISKFL